jgi:hypothetical protein
MNDEPAEWRPPKPHGESLAEIYPNHIVGPMSHSFELKPGPELDAEVAKACGIKVAVGDLCTDEGLYPNVCYKDDGSESVFRPSTDLNAAFEAAEKVGLFINGGSLSRFSPHGDSWAWYDADGIEICRNESPAMAICSAILSLEGAK